MLPQPVMGLNTQNEKQSVVHYHVYTHKYITLIINITNIYKITFINIKYTHIFRALFTEGDNLDEEKCLYPYSYNFR